MANEQQSLEATARRIIRDIDYSFSLEVKNQPFSEISYYLDKFFQNNKAAILQAIFLNYKTQSDIDVFLECLAATISKNILFPKLIVLSSFHEFLRGCFFELGNPEFLINKEHLQHIIARYTKSVVSQFISYMRSVNNSIPIHGKDVENAKRLANEIVTKINALKSAPIKKEEADVLAQTIFLFYKIKDFTAFSDTEIKAIEDFVREADLSSKIYDIDDMLGAIFIYSKKIHGQEFPISQPAVVESTERNDIPTVAPKPPSINIQQNITIPSIEEEYDDTEVTTKIEDIDDLNNFLNILKTKKDFSFLTEEPFIHDLEEENEGELSYYIVTFLLQTSAFLKELEAYKTELKLYNEKNNIEHKKITSSYNTLIQSHNSLLACKKELDKEIEAFVEKHPKMYVSSRTIITRDFDSLSLFSQLPTMTELSGLQPKSKVEVVRVVDINLPSQNLSQSQPVASGSSETVTEPEPKLALKALDAVTAAAKVFANTTLSSYYGPAIFLCLPSLTRGDFRGRTFSKEGIENMKGEIGRAQNLFDLIFSLECQKHHIRREYKKQGWPEATPLNSSLFKRLDQIGQEIISQLGVQVNSVLEIYKAVKLILEENYQPLGNIYPSSEKAKTERIRHKTQFYRKYFNEVFKYLTGQSDFSHEVGIDETVKSQIHRKIDEILAAPSRKPEYQNFI